MVRNLHSKLTTDGKRKNRRFDRSRRRKARVPTDDELDAAVVNISPLDLPKEVKLTLHKGLGFAIQPPEFDRKKVLEGFTRFQSNLQKEAGTSHQVKAFCESVSKDIQGIMVERSDGNISRSERRILKSLRDNPDVVIKPADKGRSVVLWDRPCYIREMERQLSDPNTYVEEKENSTRHYEEIISSKLDVMESEGLISAELAEELRPSNSRTPPMYGLPKIHKLDPPVNFATGAACKARPIVSACGCPTERISAYIDDHIRPLAQSVPSYLKDTTDFLRKLSIITVG
jgi:hypothetical protein